MKNLFRTKIEEDTYNTIYSSLDDSNRELLKTLLYSVYKNSRVRLSNERNPNGKLKHGIFTKDITRGKQYIDELTKDKVVIESKNSHSGYYVSCLDEEYHLYNYNQHSRGCRMHYAHVDETCIDSELDYEILNIVIKPCLSPAYRLYESGDRFDETKHLLYWRSK